MPSRDAAYHGIVEAFELAGCPVCRVVDASTVRYFDALIHENVNDVVFRDELRDAHGFCRDHAWMLANRIQGAALGAAILYRDILNTLNSELMASARGSRRTEGWGRGASLLVRKDNPASSRVRCPACKLSNREESMYLGVLVEHTGDDRFIERYEASHGVCFPHFNALLRRSRLNAQMQKIIDAHQRIVDRLIAELDLFQWKSDYRRADERFGAEADSWRRAIDLAVGAALGQRGDSRESLPP